LILLLQDVFIILASMFILISVTQAPTFITTLKSLYLLFTTVLKQNCLSDSDSQLVLPFPSRSDTILAKSSHLRLAQQAANDLFVAQRLQTYYERRRWYESVRVNVDLVSDFAVHGLREFIQFDGAQAGVGCLHHMPLSLTFFRPAVMSLAWASLNNFHHIVLFPLKVKVHFSESIFFSQENIN
jgi:hypothetical protein